MRWILFVTGLIVLLFLIVGYWTRETSKIEAAAKTLTDWSKKTDEQEQAIQILESKSDDSRTKNILISILTDRRTRPDVRVKVTAALSKRREPEISDALSRVLLPQNPFALRFAAVEGIQGHQCHR